MTRQIREYLTYKGQMRPIWALPLNSYFNTENRSPFAGTSSACWRGYQGTWEIRDDALHLVAVEGTGQRFTPLGLHELFPDHTDSVEATWFSGEITPDDVVPPDDEFRVESYRLNNRPLQFLWFVLVVHKGKLILEESVDLETRNIETRLTRYVDLLLPEKELSFLHAIRANLDDPTKKAAYADWLEQQDDSRCQLLRAEAERFSNEGPRRRAPPLMRWIRQDIATGFVNPEDTPWYWRSLADIPTDGIKESGVLPLESKDFQWPQYRYALYKSHNNPRALLTDLERDEAEREFRAALRDREQQAAEHPSAPDFQNDLAGTLVSIALLRNAVNDWGEARKLLEQARPHHEAALKARPHDVIYNRFYRNNLAALSTSLLGLGNHAAAAETARKLVEGAFEIQNNRYDAARIFSRCVPLAEKDTKLSEAKREGLFRTYADEAMDFLGQAIVEGYIDAGHMKKDTDLDPIRKREDFKKLIAELEAKQK
jgi:uncharacterized protein (TIGR02996 family)